MSTFCVITTVNKPTPQVRAWESIFGERLIVIGDEKTPVGWPPVGRSQFFDLEQQGHGYTKLESSKYTPANHYNRKNIGYLKAMAGGCGCIFDTDDDNAPNTNWTPRVQRVSAEVIVSPGWCNIYSHMQGEFSERVIWPRGLPLTQIRDSRDEWLAVATIDSPIQQGLADRFPDVDAIHRLIDPGIYLFERKRSIALGEGVWCPFNSQSTWWFPEAFPLMYLPVTATMRMTDIWRSLVAQRCLWAMGKRVVFHSPSEVDQDRNQHDLMSDFASELPGYLHNEKIAKVLDALTLNSNPAGIYGNLRVCYLAMTDNGFLPECELRSLDAWIKDVRGILSCTQAR